MVRGRHRRLNRGIITYRGSYMTGLRFFLLSLAAVLPLAAQHSDDLNFLAGLDEFDHIREMLPSFLKRHALEFIDKRDRLVAQFATLDDLARRKTYVREVITRDVGGFPERTPLNPRITGVLDRGDYTGDAGIEGCSLGKATHIART